jgi:hypothetical protein
MKGLIFALMMVSGAVSAETITLGTEECGILKQCVSIPNDVGDAISLYGAPGFSYFYVYIDNVYYVSPVASGTQMVNVSMQSFVSPDPTNPSAKQFTGSYLTISGTFTTYRTCTHSGRGQTCSTHWALIGGTITR